MVLETRTTNPTIADKVRPVLRHLAKALESGMPGCKPALPLLLLVGCGAWLAGCVRVHPWQREIHARPVMRPELEARERILDDHVNDYREGSVGGDGTKGGGCGCN